MKRFFLLIMTCLLVLALPGCSDDAATESPVFNFSVSKPSNPSNESSNKPNENVEIQGLIAPYPRPDKPEQYYLVDPSDVYPMDTTLKGPFEPDITISIKTVILTDNPYEGIEPHISYSDYSGPKLYREFYEEYPPEVGYLFVTYTATNTTNIIKDKSIVVSNITLFMVDDNLRVRKNYLVEWPIYQSDREGGFNGNRTTFQPKETREVLIGYAIDKRQWFTEVDDSESWHFFLGLDEARDIWPTAPIPYYGWLVDDDRILYQGFERG